MFKTAALFLIISPLVSMIPSFADTDSKTQNPESINYQELDLYFHRFIETFPVVKFSGFFKNKDKPQTGLHISNCHNNFCEVYYNDYTHFNKRYSPLPECKSINPVQIIDSTHAKIGNVLLRIKHNELHIQGQITFECEPFIITYNLDKVGARNDSQPYEEDYKQAMLERNAKFFNALQLYKFKRSPTELQNKSLIENATPYKIPNSQIFTQNMMNNKTKKPNNELSMQHKIQETPKQHEDNFTHAYQITLKDAILEANAVYPVNLDCIHRQDFITRELCVEPSLSDEYSFGQFFIYLASQKPHSFRAPKKIYQDYRIMQEEISRCEFSSRHFECISTALGKFETQTKLNLILDNSNKREVAYYKLLY